MFKKKIGLIVFVWTLLVLFMVKRFSLLTDEDVNFYRQLTNSSTNQNQKKDSHQAKQQRRHVSKHFLFTQGPERLQFYLQSRESELVLDQKEKANLVEYFKDMFCITQEGLLYTLADGREAKMQSDGQLIVESTGSKASAVSMKLDRSHPHLKHQQLIREIEAEKAIYHYRTKDLFANKVKVRRYIAKGHVLNGNLKPLSLLMKGYASGIQVSLSNQNKPFKAQGLQMTLHEQGKGL